MDYTVKVVVKQAAISDEEKADRITQFNQAFVTAAVDYYTKKKPLYTSQSSNQNPPPIEKA
ncbi:MAG: hypothetical protein FWE42_00585 [Defluviitaleaceae bacterium]|nr:hypothetical protein [Defluviitaleaceae bacterium]